MKRIATFAVCFVLLLGLLCADCKALSIKVPETDVYLNNRLKYEEFIADARLPFNFVHASRFHMLGDMTSCAIRTSTHHTYRYKFTSGIEIRVTHFAESIPAGLEPLTKIPQGTTSMVDMPAPGGTDRFCYFRNGLYYIYSNSGKLESIEWFADKLHFQIPIDRQKMRLYVAVPVISRLLATSESDADSAITELCESAGLHLQTEHFRIVAQKHNGLVRAVFLAGIAVTVIVCWIAAKKRRARRAVPSSFQTAALNTAASLERHTFADQQSPFHEANSP